MAISASKWGRRGSPPHDFAAKRELYLHHTVTSDEPRTRAEERAHMRQLEQFHLNRGFRTIGYNGVLFRSGRLYEGRGFGALPAAQGGRNTGTVAIAYVADLTHDKMTRRAKLRFISAGVSLRVRRGVRFRGGHQEAPGTSGTACPGIGGMRFVRGSMRKTGLRRIIFARLSLFDSVATAPERDDDGTLSVCGSDVPAGWRESE